MNDLVRHAKEFAECGDSYTGSEVRLCVYRLADEIERLERENNVFRKFYVTETAYNVVKRALVDANVLLKQSAKALEYHVEQTRPIAATNEVLVAIHHHLENKDATHS